MPAIDRNATVAEIVTAHAVTARIFQKHRIDFCCHGDVSVAEACRPRALDPEAVFAELDAALPQTDGDDDPRALSSFALVARIVDRHHAYLRRTLPFLEPLAHKVASVHGDHNPRLFGVRDAFLELAAALEPHLDHEEAVLFPALLSPAPDREILRRELDGMMSDHLQVGALLERIRSLSEGFTVPEWGCRSYRVLMSELETLEADVLRHVHLENHVLMPRFAGRTAAEARS
jgi:regulator of cell morphogenesis and NO signaling